MAYTNTGINVQVSSNVYPTNWEPQLEDFFKNYSYSSKEITITIPKSDVEAANTADTFNNIVNNPTVGILKQVVDIMGELFDDSKDIEYWVLIKDITHNLLPGRDFYKDTPVNYELIIRFYVKEK